MKPLLGRYSSAQGKLILCLLADGDDGVRLERISRNFEILGSRAFADPAGGVVMRAVAGAEIASELPLVLAFGRPQRDAAQMGAHAHRDQPLRLALGGSLRKRLGVAKLAG